MSICLTSLLHRIEEPLDGKIAPKRDVKFASPDQSAFSDDAENKRNPLISVSTPNAKLLKSVEKSAKKEILMNFWLSKGLTPKKL
jgi:hypothetical protein